MSINFKRTSSESSVNEAVGKYELFVKSITEDLGGFKNTFRDENGFIIDLASQKEEIVDLGSVANEE